MSYNNALRENQTPAPEAVHQVLQVVPDVNAQNYASNMFAEITAKKESKTWSDNIPYPLLANDPLHNNMYAGMLTFMLKPSFRRQHGLPTLISDRAPVLTSATGLPAFPRNLTVRPRGAADDENYRNDLNRQRLEKSVNYWGVSKGNYNGNDNSEFKDSDGDGFTTLTDGIKTITVWSPESIPAGTEVVFGFPLHSDINKHKDKELAGGAVMTTTATVRPRSRQTMHMLFRETLESYLQRPGVVAKRANSTEVDDAGAAALVFTRNANGWDGISVAAPPGTPARKVAADFHDPLNFRAVKSSMITNAADVLLTEESVYVDMTRALLQLYHTINLITLEKFGVNPATINQGTWDDQLKLFAHILPFLFDSKALTELMDNSFTAHSAAAGGAGRRIYHFVDGSIRKDDVVRATNGSFLLIQSVLEVMNSAKSCGVILRELAGVPVGDPIKVYDFLSGSPS